MEYRYCPVCASELVMRHDSESGADGEKARLACPIGHWTHWDNPIPVLAALVEVENRTCWLAMRPGGRRILR